MDISLGLYTIRLYDSTENEEIHLINNKFGVNIPQLLKECLTSYNDRMSIIKKDKTVFRVDKIITNDHSALSGIIKTGYYGIESEGINIDTSKQEYIRTPEVADVLPFYFRVDCNLYRGDQLYVALQRIGNFGTKVAFETEISKFLRLKFEEYRNLHLKVYDLVPEKALKNYLEEGFTKNITFTKHIIPEDFADFIKNKGAIPQDYEIDYVLRKKNTKSKGFRFGNLFNKNGVIDSKQIIEVKDKNFNYDKVKTKIELNGKTRTIDFSDLKKFKAYYTITNDIEILESGHPKEESIEKVTIELMDDIISNIEIK